MSLISSIILTVSCAEVGFDPEENDTFKIDMINGFIRGRGHRDLIFLTPHMVNGKHPQTLTFGGSFNFFPNDEFLDFLATVDWKYPENAVLVLQPESGEAIVWRP